jgi:hypothetical protein
LTRQSIVLESFLRSVMDTRVKPAYDEPESRQRIRRAVASAAALLFARPRSGLAATKGLRQTSFAIVVDPDVGEAR